MTIDLTKSARHKNFTNDETKDGNPLWFYEAVWKGDTGLYVVRDFYSGSYYLADNHDEAYDQFLADNIFSRPAGIVFVRRLK